MYSYFRKFVATNPHALKRTLSGIGPKYYKPLRKDWITCGWWGSGVVAGWTLTYIYCNNDYPPPPHPPLFNFI